MCKDVRCPGTRGMPCISRKYDGFLEKPTIQELNVEHVARLQWVTENMLEFDYCTDIYRYPEPHPECSRNAGIHSGPELQEHNSFSHQNPGHTSSL